MFASQSSYQTDANVQSLLAKLKFISNVNKYEKINCKNFTFEQNTMWSSLRRFFYNENRFDTFDFVRTTINQSFALISVCYKEQTAFSIQCCKNLISDIKMAKIGIENLQQTYSADKMFYSKLSVMLQNIDTQLEDIATQFPVLSNSNNVNVNSNTIQPMLSTNSPKSQMSTQSTNSSPQINSLPYYTQTSQTSPVNELTQPINDPPTIPNFVLQELQETKEAEITKSLKNFGNTETSENFHLHASEKEQSNNQAQLIGSPNIIKLPPIDSHKDRKKNKKNFDS